MNSIKMVEMILIIAAISAVVIAAIITAFTDDDKTEGE